MADLHSNRWYLLIVWAALCVVHGGAFGAGATRDPATHFFDETFGDFRDELASAREQGKKGIMIFFEQADCPFCYRMKHTVLNREDVQTWFRQRFLLFSVDTQGQTEVTDFDGNAMPAKDFAFKVNRVRATPVIAFYDLAGRPVARYTGATKDAAEFLLLGEFVAGRHYLDTNFMRFKRQHGEVATPAP